MKGVAYLKQYTGGNSQRTARFGQVIAPLRLPASEEKSEAQGEHTQQVIQTPLTGMATITRALLEHMENRETMNTE